MGEDAATFLHFDDIEWAVESAEATPPELLDAARRSGARRKRMAVGQNGYFMNHSIMPAGFTVPIHAHDHSELLVVLEGGCTMLEGGPTLGPNDAVTIGAHHAYGFTCGPEGMRFLTIRTAEAGFKLAGG